MYLGRWPVSAYLSNSKPEAGLAFISEDTMATPATPRYVAMTIRCTHCLTEQVVHVLAKPGPAQMDYQFVFCINCNKEFDVMVPDKILDGPFPK
jgi:hypothetical protein